MVKIKICGITNLEDAKFAVECGADALGFVFAKSPRQISPENAAQIIEKIPASVDIVGVFVDEDQQKVDEIIQISNLNTVQFHGSESPEYCLHFKGKVKVIKTFRVKDTRFLEKMSLYKIDNFLLDTHVTGQPGGTGQVFDWKLAAVAIKEHPGVILAGGLNPDNICQAITVAAPFGVDVSSSLESNPGKKDLRLVKEFIDRAKSCK